jgi:hypothetical protein
MTKAGDDVEKRAAFRMPLKAGPHTITVAFLERTTAVNPLRLQPFVRSSNVGSFSATGRMHTCGDALANCSQPKFEQKPQ